MGKPYLTCALALLLSACANAAVERTGEFLANPPEFENVGGASRGTLNAQLTGVEIAGRQVVSTVYNGLYAPPTIRVRPGETIELDLVNSLQAIGQSTNLHFHGMNVSPRGDSDNIFRHAQPGETLKIRVDVPAEHAPGMYWYHSHAHNFAEWQVFGGLSGAIIVDGILDPFPELQGTTDRVMLLKNIRIAQNGRLPNSITTSDPSIHTINGQANPKIAIRPGETQLWRLGNVGANQYYYLELEGHEFYVLARDGNRATKLVPKKRIFIAPSSRLEVLVQGGPAGSYALRMHEVDTGPQGDNYANNTSQWSFDERPLATMVSDGAEVARIPLPTSLPVVKDLRNEPVAKRRTIVFSETADGNTFFINGNYFDINRVDTTVNLGTVEEWTIKNVSKELHVFHIHQLDFQVTEVNGEPVEFLGHQDTVNTPIQGEVKVLIPFTNPVIVGKFVYHCHIMEHEDAGMMAVIEVRDNKQTAELPGSSSLFGPGDICVAPRDN